MQQEQQKIGVGQYLKNTIHQSLQVFKQPKKLLPTAVIGVVWIVLGYLSAALQPFPMPLKIASFLSYAEGGLFGGVLGAVGGIAGKVVMAIFINSMILPLFEKKPPFAGVAGGIKGMFTSMSKDTARGIAPLLKGVGLALLLYLFMNINQGKQNSIIGVVALVLMLQSIGNQGGFLFGLIFSLANSLTKGKVPRYISITRFLTGMTLGFTLGVGLSLTGKHWCLILGILFLLIGIIFGLIFRTKKPTATPAQQPAKEQAAPQAPPTSQQQVAPQALPPVPSQFTRQAHGQNQRQMMPPPPPPAKGKRK